MLSFANVLRIVKNRLHKVYHLLLLRSKRQSYESGLSVRAGGRGFSPPTKRVAPGYFYWKIEEK